MLPFDAMLQHHGVSSDRDHLTPLQFSIISGIPEREVLDKIENGKRQGRWNVIRKESIDFYSGNIVEIIHIPIAEAKRHYDHIRSTTSSWWGWEIPDHFGRR